MSVTDPIIPGKLEFDAAGTPCSPQYGDVFHSASGAAEQAQNVFLAGCGLPQGWAGRDRFVILETGFGLGTNFLVTWERWRADPLRPRRLHFVSIEKHPLHRVDLARAHAVHPALARLSAALRDAWPLPLGGAHRLHFEGGNVTLTLFFGDVADYVPRIGARFDALFLDGFAPSRNPAMWAPPVLRALGRLANPGATVATWSVAAAVRDALALAGFETWKHPGFGAKRERLAGRFAPRWQVRNTPARIPEREHGERRAVVVGAGLAGCAVAERLARRGFRVEVVDAETAPARAASGNPAGVFQPLFSADDNPASRLSRAAMLYATDRWAAFEAGGRPLAIGRCGVLRLARDDAHEARQQAAMAARRVPAQWARFVERGEAAELAGAAVAAGGWWFPTAGWIGPRELCMTLLGTQPGLVRMRLGRRVHALRRRDARWELLDQAGDVVTSAPVAVVACGAGIEAISGLPSLALRRVRGQLTLIPAGVLPSLRCVVAREGYVTPAIGDAHDPRAACHTGAAHGAGSVHVPGGAQDPDAVRDSGSAHVLGATYDFDRDDLTPDVHGHAGNLARLSRLLPGAAARLDPQRLSGRAALRSVAADRLPAIGALPHPDGPGLFGVLAFASRGIVWSSLAGELLASLIDGDPLPVERDLAAAVDPARLLPPRSG